MGSCMVKPRGAAWLALTWLVSSGGPASALWLLARLSPDPQSILVVMAALVILVGPLGCAAAMVVTVMRARKRSITRTEVVSTFVITALVGVVVIAGIIAGGFMLFGLYAALATSSGSPIAVLSVVLVPLLGALVLSVPALAVVAPFAAMAGLIASLLGFKRMVPQSV